MKYAPPIAITPPITRLCVEVGTLVGSFEERVPPRDLALAHEIHASQLRELVEASGIGAAQDPAVAEMVKAACVKLDTYDPTSLSDLMRLNTHIADALGSWDVWRTRDAGASLPEDAAAPASRVSHLLEALLDWYARTDLHPLVASSVFRYEYDYIQPFARASGFTGVLWHRLMLARWNQVFRWGELEQVLMDRAAQQREAASESRRRINDAPYATFMLGCLAETQTPRAQAQPRRHARRTTRARTRLLPRAAGGHDRRGGRGPRHVTAHLRPSHRRAPAHRQARARG